MYLDVFPDGLLGIVIGREVEFCIYLVLSIQLVSIPPPYMALVELIKSRN